VDLLRELSHLIVIACVRGHDHVRPCLQEKIGPANALGETDRSDGVSTTDDNKIWIAPRSDCVTDFFLHRIGGDCMLLTDVVVKAFGIELIFQVNASSAGALQGTHGVDDMSGFPETSSYVNYQGQIHGGRNSSRRLYHIFIF
jgi:hypothetical protein